jgi:thiol-disulfide isomerase/thioredoxin
MPHLTTIASTRVYPYRLYLAGAAVLVIFIVVGAIVYNRYAKKAAFGNKFDDVANAEVRSKEADLMLFTVDWCPHCKKAAQPWADFCARFDKKGVNGYTLNCSTVNCTDPDNADVQTSVQKYGIEHYPTLKLVINGEVVDFDGKIAVESLESFVKATVK